ncbi:hypothetical protein [Pseudomonas aeruginosa]|uniref:Y-family DNA polymerase n=1 Tax=Pseudomonas aeruginosa TaxID=287 RepID=UPI00399A8F57
MSRSNEAKALGIGMGEPFFKIRDLVQAHGVLAFSSNYALYGDVSARVVRVLRELAPRLEVYSIDESFLDLAGLGRPLAGYGRHIRAEVQRLTGMPVGVGISTTKTLAKLANWPPSGAARAGWWWPRGPSSRRRCSRTRRWARCGAWGASCRRTWARWVLKPPGIWRSRTPGRCASSSRWCWRRPSASCAARRASPWTRGRSRSR